MKTKIFDEIVFLSAKVEDCNEKLQPKVLKNLITHIFVMINFIRVRATESIGNDTMYSSSWEAIPQLYTTLIVT